MLRAVFKCKGKKQNDKVVCSRPSTKVIKGSKVKVVGHITCREELGKEYNMVVEKSEGRRQIWEPRYK